MSSIIKTRGKGGKISPKGKIESFRSSIRWTKESLMAMAEYVHANFNDYQTALGSARKMNFLRKMRDELKLICSDIQLKNGFNNLIRKYKEVKKKLNLSGFGIDPEKDASLNTGAGWILKACPYFEILDEVLGTKPNICPPAIVTTATFDEEEIEIVPNIEEMNAQRNSEDEQCDDNMEQNDSLIGNEDSSQVPTSLGTGNRNSPVNVETPRLVCEAVRGLMSRKEDSTSKAPLGVFARIMSEKMEGTAKIEEKKLKAQEVHFEQERLLRKETNELEHMKATKSPERNGRSPTKFRGTKAAGKRQGKGT
ncbi:unnamed protein product [Orchesella dallaii]|uniref:Uncharacterized protein n=1 Tax=Orchesella dallaii TaxID=48710 RepID=A0ABP1RK62_9HEXA